MLKPPELFSLSRLRQIAAWNRKLHVYIGLYLLCFVAVFAISGLLLNHPKWQFSHSGRPQESTADYAVRQPAAPEDLGKARDLMGQLHLAGEIDQIDAKADGFEFRVSKPGTVFIVSVRPPGDRAAVKQIEFSGWDVLGSLHHLTGVHDRGVPSRNRLATCIWSVLMDAACIGLLVLILGGLWIWLQRPVGRLPGLIALAFGVACCVGFVWCL